MLQGFVLPVLEYCSPVWCSTADTHNKLLDRVVNNACFLTGGVFECDIAYPWSVAVLYMLYKIRCYPMHPLYGALPGPYVPVRVTCGALVTHMYTYGLPHCRTSQYHRTLILLSVSLRNGLGDTVFDGVGQSILSRHWMWKMSRKWISINVVCNRQTPVLWELNEGEVSIEEVRESEWS